MKNQIFRNLSVLTVVASTSLWSISSSAADYVLKYASVFPAVGIQGEGAKALGELIEKKSDGAIDFQFYPSGQLGNKMQAFEGLRTGAIEMSESAATDLSSFSKIWDVFSIPYLFDNGAEAVRVLNDPRVSQILLADAEKHGFKIIGYWNMGERNILNSKKPLKTPNDLSGVKIRVMNSPMLAKSINAMGATGTPMPWNDVYTAVQQGVIDGLENSAPVIEANKLSEVAKYYSLTEQFVIPDPQMISLVVYNALSPKLQAAIVEAGAESQTNFNNRWQESSDASIDALKKAGVKVNEVDKDAFRQAVAPLVKEFIDGSSRDLQDLYKMIVTVRDEIKTK
jgi:TRAP-type transport system periplasmic protein